MWLGTASPEVDRERRQIGLGDLNSEETHAGAPG